MRRCRGFTLVELMIAMAILGVVVAYLLGGFTTQHRTYVVVDEIAQAQGNARAAAELLERDLRAAAFKVPEMMAVCGVDLTNGPDSIFVSASDKLRNVDAALPLNLLATDWSANVQSVSATSITLGMGEDDIDADGTPDFAANEGVIVADVTDPNGAVACGQIANVAGTVISWTLLAGNLPVGGDPQAIPAHYYRINAAGQLWRDNVRLIDDVEDLQVAYFFDSNGNDLADAGETHGDGQGATASYDPALADGTELRDVRVNLVVTTANQDPRLSFTEGMGQVAENRTAASVNGPDRLRRRLHAASVRARNVGTR